MKIMPKSFVLIILITFASTSAMCQDTCANRANPWKWVQSGDSGELNEGSGGKASWQTALKENIAQVWGPGEL